MVFAQSNNLKLKQKLVSKSYFEAVDGKHFQAFHSKMAIAHDDIPKADTKYHINICGWIGKIFTLKPHHSIVYVKFENLARGKMFGFICVALLFYGDHSLPLLLSYVQHTFL